jgi:DNA-binding NtrC family response regulator
LPVKVLFLDDNADLGQVMEDLVQELGHQIVNVRTCRQLTGVLDRALECDVAILDINLGSGEPSGLDAYDQLRTRGYRGRVVFLTGHADSHPLVLQAIESGRARVLRKPISFEELEALLRGDGRPHA